MATLLIGADVVPTNSNLSAFAAGDVPMLLGETLAAKWLSADARLFNLETPLTDGRSPIEKCGPAMSAPLSAANGVAALRPTAAALANNHILDHGAAGLSDTLSALAAQGIPAFGAGKTLQDAAQPFLFELCGVRVGVYAAAEHEFSTASETSPGANPFDPLESPDHIRALRNACDYLIVLYHGGREHYPYPSPALAKTCRKLVSCGADLVLCQHSHCIGCMERIGSAVIVYGQGNFLFDVSDGAPCWDTGLLCEVTFTPGAEAQVSFLPVRRRPGGTELAEGGDAEAILDAFHERSAHLAAPDFLETAYREMAREACDRVLPELLGDKLLFRAANALTGHRPGRRLYSRAALLSLVNQFSCESLRETMLACLESALSDREK